MPKTDHSEKIAKLRAGADRARTRKTIEAKQAAINLDCAAALLEVHDATGISLDNWPPVRAFVEYLISEPIQENGV